MYHLLLQVLLQLVSNGTIYNITQGSDMSLFKLLATVNSEIKISLIT